MDNYSKGNNGYADLLLQVEKRKIAIEKRVSICVIVALTSAIVGMTVYLYEKKELDTKENKKITYIKW